MVTWNAPHGKTKKYTYTNSTCGRFQILRTAGVRRSLNTVLFADDTRGTTDTAFFSLFVKTAECCTQKGNYRTLAEAIAAANAE